MQFGLIGENVSYSYSKIIHEYLGELTKVDVKYDLISTPDLKQVDFSKYDGLNITIPYKGKIIDYLDEQTKVVRNTNSCNTYTNDKVGYNTDILGFDYLINMHGIDVNKLKGIVILGTGATSDLIKYYFKVHQKDVIVVSRSKTADAITYLELETLTKPIDLLINVTPVTMNQMASPISSNVVELCDFIIDINYNPHNNKLLNMASANFVKNTNGLDMLIYQAVKSFEIWTNIKITNQQILKTKDYVLSKVLKKQAIIGMPYAGKTTYGEKMAKKGYQVIDLDDAITMHYQKTPAQIINDYGEVKFREIESKILNYVIMIEYDILILGGGIVENFNNRDLLKDHLIVLFECDFDQLEQNFLKQNSNQIRPLTVDLKKLRQKYEKRQLKYAFFQNKSINVYNKR